MKKLKTAVVLILLITLGACTSNQRAKSFGGTAKLEIPCGQKVINITWKGEDLWYSTIPMEEDYVPKIHSFKEQSSFGLMEGNYLLIESKCK
ncbi:MAG: hypothetical protein ACJAVA_000240 [Flavobacteriaceae bacterium]|jgi:hypothetical protein